MRSAISSLTGTGSIDRDEIIAAVWHDVAVTDDSLIHAVSVIRRAFGDDPAHASFIETIPRRGYRFVGHVETVDPPDPSDDPPADLPAFRSSSLAPRTAAWRWRAAIAAAVIVVVVAAAIVYGPRAWTGGTNPISPLRLEQTPPPGTTIVSGGVVSPTGRQLAFVARDEVTERTALWIRALDANEARMLPGTDGAAHAFFSPDGQQIAFFRTGELVATDLRAGNCARSRRFRALRQAAAGVPAA